VTFIELVESVSTRTGTPKPKVAAILRAAILEIRDTVLAGELVKLPLLGVFMPRRLQHRSLFGGLRQGSKRLAIHFRPSRSTTMEKYGVTYDNDEMVKTGGIGSNCPVCGKVLEKERYCDNCGTEPFEKRPSTSETERG
jgi:hypothetical protein